MLLRLQLRCPSSCELGHVAPCPVVSGRHSCRVSTHTATHALSDQVSDGLHPLIADTPSPEDVEREAMVAEVEELLETSDEELLFELEDSQQYRRGCYGCGALLQSEDDGALGYLEDDLYQAKAAHRQLGQVLCRRCRSLSHGNMIPGVQSFGRPPDDSEKHLLTPDQLRAQLACVRTSKAVVVLLVDLLDASGSFFSNVRQLVGANPIVVVGTKFDLLPKGCHPADVVDWLQGLAVRKKVNSTSTHVVSSRSKLGLADAANAILRERRGRDVYVMGAANVGKSAFIRALVAEMSTMASSSFDPAAVAHSRHLPVESAMPGTTLQLIPLSTFSGNGALYDTPGLHFHHRLMHMLPPDAVKQMHPRKPLAPYTATSPLSLAWQGEANRTDSSLGPLVSRRVNYAAGKYLWGSLLRIDVLHAPSATTLTFYGPPVLIANAFPLLPADADPDVLPENPHITYGWHQAESLQKHVKCLTKDRMQFIMHNIAGSGFGSATVEQRGGFGEARTVDIPVSGQEGPLLDIAVSGLTGWVTISAPRATGRILLRAWAPRGCEIFVRPALPVRALNATSSRGPGRPQPSGAAPKARQEARGPPYAARPAGGARGGTRQPVQRIGASWWDEDQGGKGAGARPGVQPEVDYTDPAVWRTEPRQRQ